MSGKTVKIGIAAVLCFLAASAVVTAQTRSLSAIISTDELARVISSGEKLVVIDCRSPELYGYGHIPGAINIHTREIYDKNSPIENIIPPVAELAALFGANGISRDHRVVVYEDTSDAREAARMFLYLEVAGHTGVQILDGGISKWAKEKRPKTKDLPVIVPVKFVPQSQFNRFVVMKDHVAENLRNPKVILVDDRSPDEFSGKLAGKNVKRGGGHIPGAVNKNYITLVGADGMFKTPETINKELEGLGISKNKEVILYCRTCARSSLSRVVFMYHLGYPNVKVYDGSMVEWSADERMALEK